MLKLMQVMSAMILSVMIPSHASEDPPKENTFSLIPEYTNRNCNGVDLVARVEFWSKELAINDYTFTVVCGIPPGPGLDETTVGASRTFVQTKIAVIFIKPDPKEMEASIIHEVLHVFINEIVETGSKTTNEQGVRALENILVKYGKYLKDN